MTTNSLSQQKFRIPTVILYTICICLSMLFLFPIIWSFLNSIKTPSEAVAVPPTILPEQISIENYLKLNSYGVGIISYTLNSFTVAMITVAFTIVLSTLAGYGFSKFHFFGKKVLFVLILSTMMIPFQSILIPLFNLLIFLKLKGSLFGLAMVYITLQLPFGIFLMRNTFDAIPRELEEAGYVDGCSTFTVLYRILIGVIQPGIITVGIFAFLNSWNEFLAALILMSKEANFTLPIMLTGLQQGHYGFGGGFGGTDWGSLQAGVMINIIPCMILFLLLQKHYIRGLMSGSLKS